MLGLFGGFLGLFNALLIVLICGDSFVVVGGCRLRVVVFDCLLFGFGSCSYPGYVLWFSVALLLRFVWCCI